MAESHKTRHAHVMHARSFLALACSSVWMPNCVFLRVAEVASPLAWIIKVLNLVSHHGSIITSEDHAMLLHALLSLIQCIQNDPSRNQVASIASMKERCEDVLRDFFLSSRNDD